MDVAHKKIIVLTDLLNIPVLQGLYNKLVLGILSFKFVLVIYHHFLLTPSLMFKDLNLGFPVTGSFNIDSLVNFLLGGVFAITVNHTGECL